MKEGSKNQGIKKSNEKLIIIILSATIVILFLISGYYIYKDMSATPDSNGNDNSQTEGVSSTSNSNENISSQTNQVENDIEYVFKAEGDYRNSDDKIAIYNKSDMSLIRKIDYANQVDKKEINGTTLYIIKRIFPKGGPQNSTTQILDKNLNIIIDSSDFSVEYDSFIRKSDNLISFDALYDTTNNYIAVYFHYNESEENNIYIFDLKGNLVNIIVNEGMIFVLDEYFIVKENNTIKIKNYDNKVMKEITLQNGEDIAPGPEGASIGYGQLKDYIYIGISKPGEEYEYRYYPKTNELKTEKRNY